MSLYLAEHLVDLGPHGIAALTLDIGSGTPVPAAHYGYARWHQPGGGAAPADRRALFTRTLAAPEAAGLIERQRAYFAGASPPIAARERHVHGLAAGGLDTWPYHVHALEAGHAFVLFGGAATPHLLRIVDVVNDRIVWQATADEARALLGVEAAAYMPPAPVVYGHGPRHVALYLGATRATPCAIRLDHPPGLVPLALPWAGPFAALLGTPGHVIEPTDERKLARVAAWTPGAAPRELKAKPAGRRFEIAVARDADRAALALARGEIQLLDLAGFAAGRDTRESLRPDDDRLDADPAGLVFSPDGRFLLQIGESLRDGVLVDLAERRRARVGLPEWDPKPVPDWPNPTGGPPLMLRATWALTDRGGVVLEGGALTFTPFDALDWHPLPPAPAAVKRAAAAPPEALLAALRRPSLALTRAKGKGQSPAARSHAYGAPRLGAGVAWPTHDGRPMELLCEIDLAEAHAAAGDRAGAWPLPTTGWLQCFVALDAEGEVQLAEGTFDPAALLVRHETDPHAAVAALPAGHVPARALRLAPDRADLPPPDHPVATTHVAPADRAAYAAWYDRRGNVPRGWRLGGYASAIQPQTPEVLAGEETPHELLLQIDSDDVLMWGTDTGLLYVLLPAGDAARGDFTRAVGVTEGH